MTLNFSVNCHHRPGTIVAAIVTFINVTVSVTVSVSGSATVPQYDYWRLDELLRLNVSKFLSLLFSAQLVANWSALISNTTTTSLQISWQNLTQVVGQRILHFIVVIKTNNGTTLNGNIRSEQTFSDVFFGLSPYTEYRLSVFGVDGQGTAYKHNELTAWTETKVVSCRKHMLA